MVVDEAFAEAENVVFGEADAFVEFDDFGVGTADLEVDFGAAEGAEFLFGGGHELTTDTLAAAVRVDGEIVDPATVAFVAGHDGADDFVADLGD